MHQNSSPNSQFRLNSIRLEPLHKNEGEVNKKSFSKEIYALKDEITKGPKTLVQETKGEILEIDSIFGTNSPQYLDAWIQTILTIPRIASLELICLNIWCWKIKSKWDLLWTMR